MTVHYDMIRDGIATKVDNPDIKRLLETWHAAADRAGGVPPYEALSPLRLAWCRPNLMVLRPADEGRYRYEQYGEHIAYETGVDMTGKTTAEVAGELGRFFEARYDQAVEAGRPIYTRHFAGQAMTVMRWEGLTLPTQEAGRPVLVAYNKSLEARSGLLYAVLEASQDGIMSFHALRDETGRIDDYVILLANAKAADIVGMSADRMMGQTLLEILPGVRESGLFETYSQVVETGRSIQFEVDYPYDGIDRTFRVSAVRTGDGFTITFADISELKWLASTDGLTGLLNRREFLERAEAEYERAVRYGRPMALIFLDLDRFKAINDTHGHAAGDRVLSEIAARLRRRVRRQDVVGRLGGEEFAVCVPEVGVTGACGLAESLRRDFMATPVRHADIDIPVTSSFGVAAFIAGEDGLGGIMHRADEALYAAKRDGRNRVMVGTAVGPEPAP